MKVLEEIEDHLVISIIRSQKTPGENNPDRPRNSRSNLKVSSNR